MVDTGRDRRIRNGVKLQEKNRGQTEKKKELHTSEEKLFKPIETVCLAMVRKMYPWKNIL